MPDPRAPKLCKSEDEKEGSRVQEADPACGFEEIRRLVAPNSSLGRRL
jgi:hypothetical protein